MKKFNQARVNGGSNYDSNPGKLISQVLRGLGNETHNMPGPRIDLEVELGLERAREVLSAKSTDQHRSITALGCWEYRGSVNTSNYPQVYLKRNSNLHLTGRAVQTAFPLHGIAIYAATGNFSSTLQVSHLCDNTRCFNPAHLVYESAAVNNSRKGCWGDICCPDHGHVIVQFCAHSPKCVRPQLVADQVVCCLTMRQIASEHSDMPNLAAAFASSSMSSGSPMVVASPDDGSVGDIAGDVDVDGGGAGIECLTDG